MLVINGALMCNKIGSSVNDVICVIVSNVDKETSKKP